MVSKPKVVNLLIFANVAAWIATYWTSPNIEIHSLHLFALYFPKNPEFAPWQFFTSLFMHDGSSIMHIFFNMFALYSFGTFLEKLWGGTRFLIFYFLCGLGAGFVHIGISLYQFDSAFKQLVASGFRPEQIDLLLKFGSSEFWSGVTKLSAQHIEQIQTIYNSSIIGASGAIYGVLAAFGFTFPNAKLSILFLPIPIAAKYIIPALICFDLVSGLTGFRLFGYNVAHFAHVGGAVVGFALMLYWNKGLKPKRPAEMFFE